MKYILILILLSTLLFSCINTRKVQSFLAENPAVGAKYCADNFAVRDTVTITKDSVYFDTLYVAGEIFVDTVYKEGKWTILRRDCPQNTLVTKTVNTDRFLYVRDRAYEQTQSDSIAQLHQEKASLQNDNSKLLGEKAQLKGQAKDSKKYLWWLIAVCALVLGAGAVKLFKLFKPSINIQK